MPTLPADRASATPDGVDPSQLTWVETLAGGGYGSVYLQVGDALELTDIYGDACAHVLIYNANQPAERLNVADTIKVQWQAYLSTGSVLLSDLGRALATITGDSSERHDTLCGTTSLLANTSRYGEGSPQSAAPAGRELFKLAAAKHGLAARDIPPSISFFQGVRANLDGSLSFIGSVGANKTMRLVAEMPILVLVANTAHPIDPRPSYTCTALGLTAWRGTAAYAGERTPEMARALLNTQSYLAMRGIQAGAA